MTEIEHLVRDDAERWRRAVDTVASVRSASVRSASVRPRDASPARRHGLVLAAAAAVVLIATGIAITVARSGSTTPAHAGSSTGVPATRSALHTLQAWTWRDSSTDFTATFVPGALRTYDGCSTELHALAVDADRFVVGKQIGTVSICAGTPEPPTDHSAHSEAEQAMIAADRARAAQLAAQLALVLSGTVDWSVRGHTLSLSKPGDGTIRLTAAGPAIPPPTHVGDCHR